MEVFGKVKMSRFYFNFKRERENLAKNQTNFTSPVTLIIGLNESIKLLRKEGLENVFKRHKRLANATRAGVKALGLELYPKESPSNSVTAVCAPAGIDGQAIYKNLREEIRDNSSRRTGPCQGKDIQDCASRYADTFDVITAIAGLEMVLKGMGHPVKLGAGVAAAEELLMK